MFKRLAILGVIALVVGVSARYIVPPTPAVADFSAQVASQTPTVVENAQDGPRWKPVWIQPAPNLVDAAVSPDGAHVSWIDREGSARHIDSRRHRTVWRSSPLFGANDVEVTVSGTVLAFSRMNPAKPVLRILDSVSGEKRSALLPLTGAIWKVSVTPDGTRALVGTGDSLLYFIPLRHDAVYAGVPLKLPGIAEDIAIARNEPVAFFSTWQSNGVCLWGLDQNPRWRHEDRRSDYSFQVLLSGDGSTAIALATRGPRRQNAQLYAWDAHTGKLLWIESLDGFAPRAAVSANGQVIAVSFSRAAESGNPERIEQKIVMYDRIGQRLFDEKGGVFFSPELVCLAADGSRVTVQDRKGDLWTLDNQGRTIARLPQPDGSGPIRKVIASESGNHLLVYRSDGTLTFYRASAI